VKKLSIIETNRYSIKELEQRWVDIR